MNIVITGLASSGKTSVGKKIAAQLNFDFIDLDNHISSLHKKSKNEKLSVQDIFIKYGEKYFRNLEKKAVKGVTYIQNCVIATGGGTLEDKENAEILKKDGMIIFLNVDIGILAKRIRNQSPRPIFKGLDPIEILKKMSEKRMPLFEQFSDVVVDASLSSIDDIVNQIIEVIR